MTKIYVTSTKSSWKSILAICHIYKNLIETEEVIKSGGYYPRLKETNKRGLRAYNELIKKHFSGLDLENITIENCIRFIMVCKSSPEVYFDILIFEKTDYEKICLNNSSYFNHDCTTTEELPEQLQDITEKTIPEETKIETVMTTIDGLEFNHDESLKLISKIIDKLISH
tara:strand:- start:283 stop:792 length:510 start_codon:yes stop_codon:yes gene_type:complete